MMMDNLGFIKTYRKILDNPIVFKDTDYFAIWIYLLLKATHTNCKAIFKGEEIILKPGQLIIGRKSIAEKLKVDENKVQRVLKSYEIQHQIEQQMSNKNRLITIVNWNKYQSKRHQNEQQVNNKRTTSEQQVNTNKNDKNIKNVKNIYLYFINKYKSNEKNFSKQMKIISKMRQDEKWNELTQEEQLDLQSAIFEEE